MPYALPRSRELQDAYNEQLRQAYEFHATDLGQFTDSPEDVSIRRAIHALDRTSLGEARKLFATSQNVAERLYRSTGLTAEVLPHPPQEAPLVA